MTTILAVSETVSTSTWLQSYQWRQRFRRHPALPQRQRWNALKVLITQESLLFWNFYEYCFTVNFQFSHLCVNSCAKKVLPYRECYLKKPIFTYERLFTFTYAYVGIAWFTWKFKTLILPEMFFAVVSCLMFIMQKHLAFNVTTTSCKSTIS